MTADDTLASTTAQLTYLIGIIGILYSAWKLMAAPRPGFEGLVLQPTDQPFHAPRVNPPVNPPANPPENLHEPSIADVLVVKAMLIKALSLPPEIVDSLIDLAEYWPHTTSGISFERPTTVAQGRIREDAFLVSLPASSSSAKENADMAGPCCLLDSLSPPWSAQLGPCLTWRR